MPEKENQEAQFTFTLEGDGNEDSITVKFEGGFSVCRYIYMASILLQNAIDISIDAETDIRLMHILKLLGSDTMLIRRERHVK